MRLRDNQWVLSLTAVLFWLPSPPLMQTHLTLISYPSFRRENRRSTDLSFFG